MLDATLAGKKILEAFGVDEENKRLCTFAFSSKAVPSSWKAFTFDLQWELYYIEAPDGNLSQIKSLVSGIGKENFKGEKIPFYPFSKTAINEIYEVTGKYARDIKMICNECINKMKKERKAWIVKDKYLAVGIEDAHRKQKQIIPVENLKKFEDRRSEWMKDSLEIHLKNEENSAKSKYYLGIENKKLLEKINSYLGALEISNKTPIEIENRENPTKWTNVQFLSILDFAGKKVLVCYVFVDKAPLGRTYFRHITWNDVTDALSYIDEKLATHILFIKHWSGGFDKSVLKHNHIISDYNDVIDQINLDDVLFKILGAVEVVDAQKKKDLVEHVDHYHLKLRASLERLVKKTMSKKRHIEKDRKDVNYF